MPFLDCGGTRLYYESEGNGPAMRFYPSSADHQPRLPISERRFETPLSTDPF